MADLTAAQQANLGMGDNPFLGQSNPYLQQNIDAASADMVKNYNLTTQPAFNAAMANSGSFGNEGVAQMNAASQSQLQQNLGNLSNTMRGQDYNQQMQEYNWQQGLNTQQSQFGQTLANQQNQWQQGFDTQNQQWNLGFDRNVYNDAYSQNLQNLQTGIGLLGTLQGYNQQDITNSTTQQNTPLNYWSQFSNGANAIGQGYGTTTGTQGTTSNPWASLIGGAQLGNAWGNQNSNSNSNSYNPYNSVPYSSSSNPYSGYTNANTYGYTTGDNQ